MKLVLVSSLPDTNRTITIQGSSITLVEICCGHMTLDVDGIVDIKYEKTLFHKHQKSFVDMYTMNTEVEDRQLLIKFAILDRGVYVFEKDPFSLLDDCVTCEKCEDDTSEKTFSYYRSSLVAPNGEVYGTKHTPRTNGRHVAQQ